MQEIIITTVVIGVIGLVIGIALVAAGKKFYVAVDEKAIAVRECLPGNNCGACGYAGCDAVAAAIAAGEAPVNACPVSSADVVDKISAIMGVEAEAAQKESQAQMQVQSQQRQLRSALSKEQYKWNNAEIYGPGGRGDEN